MTGLCVGRELAGRVYDGGPEEVHCGDEEGGQQETGQGAAPPQLGSAGMDTTIANHWLNLPAPPPIQLGLT